MLEENILCLQLHLRMALIQDRTDVGMIECDIRYLVVCLCLRPWEV